MEAGVPLCFVPSVLGNITVHNVDAGDGAINFLN